MTKQTLIKQALLPDGTFADVRITGQQITQVAPLLREQPEDEKIDAEGYLLYPGLVNTHHHLFQSLLKGVPEGLHYGLGDWLPAVPYRYWPQYTPQMLYNAALLGFSDLLKSGCTTCADHHYLYHRDISSEMEAALFQAAEDVGIRLVLCRGGSTASLTHRGMQQAGVSPESLDQYLTRLQDTVSRYHDPGPLSMRRVVAAPTSLLHSMPFDALREVAHFARDQGLRLHSHLLEVPYDDQVAWQKYGMCAVDYAASAGWLGDDVWFAHLVHTSLRDIENLAASGTGVAHCPVSNARLGNGIARVLDMESAGMPISLGVDGSASSESGSLINEMHFAWHLHRTQEGPGATDARMVLHWASRSGAKLLGFDQLGKLAPGMAADLSLINLQHPRFAGLWAQHKAPVLCGEPSHVEHVMINGRWVLEQGQLTGIDEQMLVNSARQLRDDLHQLVASGTSR